MRGGKPGGDSKNRDTITVMTGRCSEIYELQLEGKKRLSNDAFLEDIYRKNGTWIAANITFNI